MEAQKEERGHLVCPYCDEELMKANLPYCQACKVTIFYCPKCREPVSREVGQCPHCGEEIKV